MFSVHCPRHGAEVLLTERNIESLHNTEHGIRLSWICTCGERGSLTTGRHRARRGSAL